MHLRIASPPVTNPCYYGIDTPVREELIAARESVDRIREFIGADSLGYLSMDGMLRAARRLASEPAEGRDREAVLAEVPSVRAELGYPPLVTPSSQLVGARVMKNCDPPVFGPALAMDKIPGPEWVRVGSISSGKV